MIKTCKCCDKTILNKDGLVDLKSKKLFCSKDCYNEFRANQKVVRKKLSDPEFFNAMIQSIKGQMITLGVELDSEGNFVSTKTNNIKGDGYNI